MKNYISIALLFLPLITVSQNCEEKIAIAKKNKDAGDYRLALRQLSAAALDCGSAKSAEVEQQILDIYDKIEKLKKEAEQQKKRAEAAEREAKKEADATKKALARSDSLYEVAQAVCRLPLRSTA